MKTVRSHVAAFLALCLTVAFLTGCGQPNVHANAINAFDGTTYDTLTATGAVLGPLKTQVQTSYPKYAMVFNDAASAYNTSVQLYGMFRTNPNTETQAKVSSEMLIVTQAIVALESQIQADLHPAPADVAAARAHVEHAKAKYSAKAKANVSLVDILTELELAATVAQAIPGASPYAALAQIVIEATKTAVNAVEASNGTRIDVGKLPVLVLLPV